MLLLFLPATVLAEQLGMGDGVVFLCSVGAILPLAVWLSAATEELAVALGPSIGALLNALFGNATELIIALTALRAGLVEIVKASISGTLIANLLLSLGLSLLVGGIGRQEQSFQPVVARVNGTAMTLAVIAMLLPSLGGFGAAVGAGGAAAGGQERGGGHRVTGIFGRAGKDLAGPACHHLHHDQEQDRHQRNGGQDTAGTVQHVEG